jgi:UDPglucose 6-dehydrogenase
MLRAALGRFLMKPDATAGADALVLITEWNEFRALSPVKLAAAMRGRIVVDLRNVYDPCRHA